MMSVTDSEQFLSLDSKTGNMLTVEEARDHYRQRFQNMKLVLKELQQQVTLYKTRCSGVSTVALMLKESKQEVVKLNKQHKALETVIANLQNRLSTNGLSSSVNIEETELFVPGASKQTLDNLAKENARLRTLLKNHEGQTGKKSSEDVQKMAALLENLGTENNQLRAQLSEMDRIKAALTNQYEEEIRKIKDQLKTERLQREEQTNQYQQGKVNSPKNNETIYDIEGNSKASQTVDVEVSKIDEVRRALRYLSDHCAALDQSLENVQIATQTKMDNEAAVMDKSKMVSKEIFMELEQKANQVIQMNQRWQAYNENQEQQIHGMVAKIAELEELNKEIEELRGALDSKEIENQNLKRDITNLTRDINKLRSQPHADLSLVEILKQQIQVCTEDFNTERKDREHSVNKAKQLQEEVNRRNKENEQLRRDNENLRKVKNSPEVAFEKRDNHSWMRPQLIPHYAPRPTSMLPQRLPFSSTSPGSSIAHSLSPVPSPVPMSFSSTSSAADRSSFYPPSSQESISGFQTPPRGGYRQLASPTNIQTNIPRARGPQDVPPASGGIQKPAGGNASMPALSVKTEGTTKSKQPDLTCPKCGKEFTENQQSELISHINTCTE